MLDFKYSNYLPSHKNLEENKNPFLKKNAKETKRTFGEITFQNNKTSS